MKNKKERSLFKPKWLFVVLKYSFSLVTVILACSSTHNWLILPVAIAELFFIWSISNSIYKKMPAIGYFVQLLLLLIFDAQMLVMYFGNSYITLLMLTNLVSLQDLGGNFDIYMLFLIPMLVILVLPMRTVKIAKKQSVGFGTLLGFVTAIWLCVTMIFGFDLSPMVNVGLLVKDTLNFNSMRINAKVSRNADIAQFYRENIEDCISRPLELPEKPNIILVFVEGLSQNIIENERNLMPNMAELEKKGLFFENYYNHTFATYRGIIGQLYSGYQLADFDANVLSSLQSILHQSGYETAFINTEPNNPDFTAYLRRMNFDDFITRTDWATMHSGVDLTYLTDKIAFDKLFETAALKHNMNKPFFIGMYTFGTHASFDSPDEVYGDGSNAELSKFYNLDCQLGTFMKRFEESELSQDTMLIVTADHASALDKAFSDSFPDYNRENTEVDRIPLVFYYKDMNPGHYDASCRNTLDLAPTLLDYIDISRENYFLGQSLFKDEGTNPNLVPEHLFFDGTTFFKSDNEGVGALDSSESHIAMDYVVSYFSLCNAGELNAGSSTLKLNVSDDCSTLSITLDNSISDGNSIVFSVWGSVEGQNDCECYNVLEPLLAK